MDGDSRRLSNADNIRAWSEVTYEELNVFGDEGDFARQQLLTPALLALLGDVNGTAILDAGAGNGYLSRKLARMGAKVTALEPSSGPFEYLVARERQEPLGVTCIQQDLSALEGYDGVFDSVVANLVLLDIVDFKPAIANCLAATRPGGSFIFSLEHPFTGVADRSEVPFKVHDYFTERCFPRTHGHNFHRTLETYIDTVADGGALIERVREPRLDDEVARAHPEHAWSSQLPAFIVVLARKLPGTL